MTIDNCSICGAEAQLARTGPVSLNLQKCTSCNIIFLQTRNAADHARHSQEQYFDEMDRGRWQRFLDAANSRVVLRRIRKYKPAGRLLEIGIGNGNFLRAAQRAGYECMGVEASPGLARSFTNESAIPVFAGYLNEFIKASPGEGFDVLVMNHVLEHIPDPFSALKQIRSLLKKDGVAHLAVPNVEAWEAKLPGWTSYEPYHLYYFAPMTLSCLARQAGFQVSRLETTERFSGWTNALVRTLLQRSFQELRLSGARRAPSGKQRVAKVLLNVARVGLGTITLPLRLVQAHCRRGEELITILSTQ